MLQAQDRAEGSITRENAPCDVVGGIYGGGTGLFGLTKTFFELQYASRMQAPCGLSIEDFGGGGGGIIRGE